jgi:hypothetical protein
MRNSFNFYPVVYKILAVIVCFLLVLIYNKSRADSLQQNKHVYQKADIKTIK